MASGGEEGERRRFVVVGGGIAGVSCAEELARSSPETQVFVISDSPLIKAATNVVQQSRVLETFDVEEKEASYLERLYGNVTVLSAHVTALRHKEKVVECSDGRRLAYDKLCVCTGARPRLIAEGNPRVIGIRDTESVEEFQEKLKEARRIVVVGNGGIATELVYELRGCEVLWVIRHTSICHTFVDEGAAVFFLPQLHKDHTHQSGEAPVVKRTKYECEGVWSGVGSALGPDWQTGRQMAGKTEGLTHVQVEYETEVADILTGREVISRGLEEVKFGPHTPDPKQGDQQWPVYVLLTNGRLFGCDLVVSATGVFPNTSGLSSPGDQIELRLSGEGGVAIDDQMRTSLSDVYAAGDVCTANWSHSHLWFQMRLWTQGRQMGAHAARAMVAHSKNEDIALDFCFELFAHVTKFFGFKVVLLGRYNAQGLTTDQYEVLLRCTKGVEYVKVVLQDGRMVGAVLIGETDLEETFENLILNKMDLTDLKDHLLDPRVDIDDFFD